MTKKNAPGGAPSYKKNAPGGASSYKKNAPGGASSYKKNAPRGAPGCSFRMSSTSSCCSLLASRARLKEWITMLVHITQVSRVLSRGIAPMLCHRVRVLDADLPALHDQTSRSHGGDDVLGAIGLPDDEVRTTSDLETVVGDAKDLGRMVRQHVERVPQITRCAHVTADRHEEADERGVC